jgi:hypothetical protein
MRITKRVFAMQKGLVGRATITLQTTQQLTAIAQRAKISKEADSLLATTLDHIKMKMATVTLSAKCSQMQSVPMWCLLMAGYLDSFWPTRTGVRSRLQRASSEPKIKSVCRVPRGIVMDKLWTSFRRLINGQRILKHGTVYSPTKILGGTVQFMPTMLEADLGSTNGRVVTRPQLPSLPLPHQ